MKIHIKTYETKKGFSMQVQVQVQVKYKRDIVFERNVNIMELRPYQVKSNTEMNI